VNAAWPHGDPRDVARAIVADPRYAQGRTSRTAQASWFDLVRAWLGGLLRGLLHGIDRALGAHNTFETAIGFGVIFGGLALLGWGIALLVRSYARGPGRRGRPDPSAGAVAAGANAAGLRAAALEAARAGRYRAAAALLFAWVVRALDESGRVAFDPARTPGEYRRLVRDPLFDELTGDAVVAVFAPAEPSAELFERLNGACERFLRASGR
jgi:hypothetical protein